jgi:ADP-L-glycero-D-manno-heptose 6-epimerase
MIIVTGGVGFIGSNLVALLERSGAQDIVICDRLREGEAWRNIGKREIAAFVQPEDLMPFLELHAHRILGIFHLGAISSTTEPDSNLVVQTNLQLSLDLWDWCVINEVRFIYASSAATYGDGSHGFEDVQTPEGLANFIPLNNYAWSKHTFDRRVARLVTSGEHVPPQWAGLKFFNVYGPNEYHKGNQMSVVHTVWKAAKAGQPARLFKSYQEGYPHGGQKRDFVWVGNCAAFMKFLWEHPEKSGLFNVGTGEARSFEDLANATFDALGLPPKIEYIDMPEAMRPRYQYFTQAETAKIRAAGFVAPFTSLEEGVKKYVQEFLEAEDPYR